MQRYIAWRLALFLPTVFAASLLVFGIMRVVPGDVAFVVLGGSGETPQDIRQIEKVREELGLNDPLPVQYGKWAWSMVNGQFGGRSYEDRTPIRTLIAQQMPVTVLLAAYTLAVSLVVSVPLGMAAALKQDRWPDYLVRGLTIAGQTVPSFFLALLVILGLLRLFHWTPPIIYYHPWQDPWQHIQLMVWPTLVLAWSYSAYIARMTRAGLLEVLRHDYIRTAYTKGLPMRLVVLRHALPNALIPIISVAGLQVGALLGGAIIVEVIFGVPGLGRGLAQAALARDYPVIQSLATLLVLLMLCVNLIADLLYARIDPRITYAA